MTPITKLLAIALFLLLVTLSLNFSLLPMGGYDAKRIMEVLLISLVLISAILQPNVLARSARSKVVKMSGSVRIMIYVIFFLACLSALYAPSPRHAFLEVSLFAGLIYLSLFTAQLWIKYQLVLVKGIVYAISLGAIFYTLGFYTGYLASFLEHIPLYWPEPFFAFSNVRAFNQYQLWTLPLLVLPLLSFGIDSAKVRRGFFLVTTSWWVLLYYSASRGVLIAILLSSGLTILFYKQFAWPMLRLLLFSAITGITAYGLLFYIIPALFINGDLILGSVLKRSAEERLGLWHTAITMIQEHPFLGVGPMHYAWYPNIYAHPHNSGLQLAAEWGLPATFLMLLMSGYGILCWLKKYNSATLHRVREIDQYLPVVLFFTITANATYSLVDGVIVMPLSQIMMAVVVGLMLGVYDNDKQQDGNLKLSGSVADRCFAIIILASLEWAVMPELLPRILGNTELIPTGYQTQGPRFWQEGGIPH
jgi:putative inorganic carbon (hco3(-)) transporter